VVEARGSNGVSRVGIVALAISPVVAEGQRNTDGTWCVGGNGANNSVIVSNVGLRSEGGSELALDGLVFAETSTVDSGRETSTLNTPSLRNGGGEWMPVPVVLQGGKGVILVVEDDRDGSRVQERTNWRGHHELVTADGILLVVDLSVSKENLGLSSGPFVHLRSGNGNGITTLDVSP